MNGKTVGSSAGVELRVANGGKLYSRDTTGQWYEWSGAKWSAIADPNQLTVLSPQLTETGNVGAASPALEPDQLATMSTQSNIASNARKANPGLKPDKKAPVVSMTLVSDTSARQATKITSNPAVKGVGQANTLVTIKEGGATLGTTMADATGAWSFTPGRSGRRRAHAHRQPDRSRRQHRNGDAELYARQRRRRR